MLRTESTEKTLQNRQRNKRTRSSPKSDKSAFFVAHESAPAFPADIIIAAPKRTKAKSPQMPLPFIAVQEDETKPVVARKPRTTNLKKTAKKKIIGKTAKAATSRKLKAETSLPKLRATRETAAKLQPLASTAPEIAKTELQAAPLEKVTAIETPVAVPPLQNPITVDTPAQIKPLPRSAAVTAYRKNGPLDALAYWLRSSGRSFTALFKRSKPVPIAPPSLQKAPITEIDRLRDENIVLQQRIETLLAAQNKTSQ